MRSPVLELLGGGGEVGEDEVGELEDVVAFFEAEGEVGLLAGGEEQADLVFFQAAGGCDAGEIRLGEGEADAVFFLSQLRHAQGGGAGALADGGVGYGYGLEWSRLLGQLFKNLYGVVKTSWTII